MKREIKFRAWAYNKMYDWQQIKDRMILEDLLNHPDFNVMQFTGLHDKNGKDIYEGDIILYAGLNNVIQWNQLHCCWGLFQYGHYVAEMCADWVDERGKAPKEWISSEYEVIGNIYENPELL